MKNLLCFFIAIAASVSTWAQTPHSIRIQALLNEKVHLLGSNIHFSERQQSNETSSPNAIEQEQKISITQKPESELHAAINPSDTNNIVIANMRLDPNSLLNALSFTVYSTQDFGQTWFESSFTGQHPGSDLIIGGGDPVLAFESDGTLHLTWLLLSLGSASLQPTIGIYHATSTDNGISWTTRPNPITKGELQILPNLMVLDRLVDKQWMAVDRSNLISKDNLYTAYFDYQVSPDTVASIRCMRKRRNQANFVDDPVQVNTQPFTDVQFASISVDGQAQVHVSFWGSLDNVHYALYHARSIDEGASFLPETKISDVGFPLPDSASGFPISTVVGVDRLYPCPHIVADASGGPFQDNLYVMWTARGIDSLETEGYDIYFSRSTDRGQTWENPRILNDDPDPNTHQFFSNLYVNEQGVLVAAWYDRRDDPANVATHHYWTYSQNGGQSFESQNAISAQNADFSQVGALNDGFGVGEYTQIIATDGFAIPVWADGRLNDGTVSVYVAWTPLSGPATALDRIVRLQAKLQLIGWHQEGESLYINWQQAEAGEISLRLYDLSGKVVSFAERSSSSPDRIEYPWLLPGLSQGFYMLELSQAGASLRRKIWLQ
ncbi:MAG: hypothetical protein AAF927_24100 [Bacteroidota bacterium]